MKVYKLDKVADINTTYVAERYRAFIIERLGTDHTADVEVKVDDKKCGVLWSKIAPKHKVTTAMDGPLSLGPKFLVIPPDKPFVFVGTVANKVRLIGKILALALGESLPTEYLSRFAAQHNDYLLADRLATAQTPPDPWAVDEEKQLYTKTPSSRERLIFNGRFYVETTNTPAPDEAEGQSGFRFYLDGIAQDILATTMGRRGIDRFAMQLPSQTVDDELEPFTFKDNPIEVLPDIPLALNCSNVSGAIIDWTTAPTWDIFGVYNYKKV